MVPDPVLPSFRTVRQRFQVPPPVDLLAEIGREWARIEERIRLAPGSQVAIGVGSRGIANLTTVVRAVAEKLKEAGYSPFVMPAMGSHGGATAEGQIKVLAARGVTEKTVGVPIRADMEVTHLGDVEGIPLLTSRLAQEAGGIVLINRIKPHTNFVGPTESGLIKMMSVGLGNQVGAEHYHRLAVVRDYYWVLSTVGKQLIRRSNFIFGVGLVENQEHKTAFLRFALGHEVEAVETDLLIKARACMPKLPLEEIDLLIVDEMGKDISGEGIDPNVVGRDVCECGVKRSSPSVSRIFVRDLTEGSEGSALGIGQADFTTKRLVEKIDFEVTAVNCITCCCPESGRVPLTYPNDRDAIAAALPTIRPYTLEDVRIVHIKNTMELNTMLVSVGCLSQLAQSVQHGLDIDRSDSFLRFDNEGNLLSIFSEGVGS